MLPPLNRSLGNVRSVSGLVVVCIIALLDDGVV
jgi:hypothetical protein